jgi:Tfp pilus assembly protein PilN
LKRPLNLARRPLRNDRLPTLLLLVGCLALVGVTARHVVAARNLLPERTSAVDGELVALENELDRLRREAGELGDHEVSPETLKEWAAVRRLVDHRTFAWSALMASLEETTPPGIRLVSIAPSGEAGHVQVALIADGRTVEDGLEFLEALQAREEFRKPFLNSVSEAEGEIRFSFSVGYVPSVRAAKEAS